MVKINKSNTGQYRVTINPELIRIFGIDIKKEHEWIMVKGKPTLQEVS